MWHLEAVTRSGSIKKVYFFGKVSGWRLTTLSKKRLLHRCVVLQLLLNFLNKLCCTKHLDKFSKLCKNSEISQWWNVLEQIFYIFVAQLLNFSFPLTSLTLAFNTTHFWDFPETSPKILRLYSFGIFWGNLGNPSMVIMTYFSFCCG